MPKTFITRNLIKNSTFKSMLSKVGMEIIGQSLIRFSPISFSVIPKVDWIFFYSKNGIKYFFQCLEEDKTSKIFTAFEASHLKWAAIGTGTAEALKQKNIQIDFIGKGHPKSTAKDFLKIAPNQKVLFVQAKNSKQSVQKLLEGKIEVHNLVVYENKIQTDFTIPYCDNLVFTSPLNGVAYFQQYKPQINQKIFAIGNTTASALKNLGLKNIIVAKKPTEKDLAKVVLSHTTPHKSQIATPYPNRYAVIDLGTNTFHLLVAEKVGGIPSAMRFRNLHSFIFKELHRERFFVKLAEEGIEAIGKKQVERGMNALKTFRVILDKWTVTKVKAIGTAALRTASNRLAFIKTVKEKYGIKIELIDGSREAELIYKGVIMAVPFQAKNYLIMDIGGGSVEFIIANQKKILWAQSFPIGVAVLFKKFHQTEPISQTEIIDLQAFLTSFLSPLHQVLIQFPTDTLVGASGTFDVLELALAKKNKNKNHAFVPVAAIQSLHEKIINSTKEERFAMKDIPDTRADMIVVAMLLIDFILKKVNIQEIIVSNYAMKEGILSELMQ